MITNQIDESVITPLMEERQKNKNIIQTKEILMKIIYGKKEMVHHMQNNLIQNITK